MRWSRDIQFSINGPVKCGVHDDPNPYMGVFLKYSLKFDEDNEPYTNYEMLLGDGRIVCFTPFDVVKNVRVVLMEKSAHIIQKSWRVFKKRNIHINTYKNNRPEISPSFSIMQHMQHMQHMIEV